MDGEGRVTESGAVSEGRVVDGEGRVAESGAVSEGRVVDGEGRVADCGAVSVGRVASINKHPYIRAVHARYHAQMSANPGAD